MSLPVLPYGKWLGLGLTGLSLFVKEQKTKNMLLYGGIGTFGYHTLAEDGLPDIGGLGGASIVPQPEPIITQQQPMPGNYMAQMARRRRALLTRRRFY